MFLTEIILSISFFLISQIHSYTFNTENVTVISQANIVDRYFGYSLLLQNGENPTVIIGAPKERFINGQPNGGEVFRCETSGTKTCETISKSNDNLKISPNGNFLGATLDGDDHVGGLVMVCSPRTANTAGKDKIYVYGKCMFWRNSTNINKYHIVSVARISGARPKRNDTVANVMYFEYGYATLGFDISIYNKDNVLCGAPGLNDTGATLVFPLSKFENLANLARVTILPKRRGPDYTETNNYFGYSVNTAYNPKTKEVWFITGAPRANILTGKATLYKYIETQKPTVMEVIHVFVGDDFGSYFGASVLLADVTNDDMLDVIVGAPLTAGKTYDEGCAYFYKGSENTYHQKQKLTGSSKIGSRFGTSITSLGDFDLDGFNDIAISAPYEESGEGAVYIYRGGADGLENQFSQRLSPALFNPVKAAKGFGLGISRGNDIDHNGHNDMAIGAYKSDQVFIIPSYGIMEYQSHLTTTIDAIRENTSSFGIELCLNYSKRSELLNLPSVDFEVQINLDYRANKNGINHAVKVYLGKNKCETHKIYTRPMGKDINPFAIDIALNVNAGKNIKALGRNNFERKIPYAIGCTNDTVCITGLSIEVEAKRKNIILGKDHQIDVKVSVSNDGDPAYQSVLVIQAPTTVKLRNTNDCNKESGNYSCSFSDKLDRNMRETKSYTFDLKDIDLNLLQIQFNISIISFGVNKKTYKNIDILKIPIVTNGAFNILGNSDPETMEVSRTEEARDKEIVHRFTIQKFGPSPLKLTVTFLIPVIEYNYESIFKVLQVKGSIDEDALKCIPALNQVNVEPNEIFAHLNTEQIPHNRSIMIYCQDFKDCAQFTCEGRLDNSNQKAVFEIRVMVISKLIMQKFRSELRRKNLVAYLPIAVQQNTSDADDRILAPAQFIIFVQDIMYVPLWIFIVGAFIGMVLLILLVVSLYKCSFFKREYKDLIEEQLIQNSKSEENESSLEYAEIRPVRLQELKPVDNESCSKDGEITTVEVHAVENEYVQTQYRLDARVPVIENDYHEIGFPKKA